MQNPNENKHSENWDTGTYQTGPARPNKGQSVMITVLLMAVIFLGGLASALGVMNIRLISQLMEQTDDFGLTLSGSSETGGSSDVYVGTGGENIIVPTIDSFSLRYGEIIDSQPLTQQQILEQNRDCIVHVRVQICGDQTRSGTALVVHPDGFLLTNASLADWGDGITVTFADGEQKKAVLVASDVFSDLAVLYVDRQGLTVAEFAPTVTDGEQIYALGETGLSSGRVSEDALTDTYPFTLVKTDLTGTLGPVFNSNGQVVGFRCRSLPLIRHQGLLLAGRQVETLVSQLVEKGCVSGCPGMELRVRELTALCRQYWGLPNGVQITFVADTELAQQLQEGDILLSVNGRAVDSREELYAAIGNSPQGESLQLQIFRGGIQLSVELKAERNP